MLLVGGDSFSCWPLETMDGHRNNCWPALLGKHLNIPVIDYSRGGSSNDRIFRYILPSINPKISLIVILWSNSMRYETTNPANSKIGQITPSSKLYKIQDWYLRYVQTLLYCLSINNSASLHNIPVVHRFVFEHECWWDNNIDTFKVQLRKNLLFDNLPDDMIEQKFLYLQGLHKQIGTLNLNSITSFVETSEEFDKHPTYTGHVQITESIKNDISP